MKLLIATLTVANMVIFTLILSPAPIKVEDRVCPPDQVRVSYRADMADFVDAKGPYRIAYCKPTGVVWAGVGG